MTTRLLQKINRHVQRTTGRLQIIPLLVQMTAGRVQLIAGRLKKAGGVFRVIAGRVQMNGGRFCSTLTAPMAGPEKYVICILTLSGTSHADKSSAPNLSTSIDLTAL